MFAILFSSKTSKILKYEDIADQTQAFIYHYYQPGGHETGWHETGGLQAGISYLT